MERKFVETDVEYTNPVRLTVTSGGYSMETAAGLLQWLESNGARIMNEGWKSSGYGDLVEKGIPVEFETVVFKISCSYEHIYFERISGNKTKFWALCRLFCDSTD